jgi:hypothetical protein
MLKNKRDGITPEEDGKRGPVKFIEDLRARGHLVAYVGDVVGTGSSRKSATNSVLWFTGEDIPFVPNKRFGGVCLGNKIAPIFYNTMEDAGALPIELDVSQMNMGDVIELRPYEGKALKDGKEIASFTVKSDVLFDEVRAGGRIPVDHRAWFDRQSARSIRFACIDIVPFTCRFQKATAKVSPWRKKWSAVLAVCQKAKACCPAPTASPRMTIGRFTRHHRPDDARRVERSRHAWASAPTW